MKVMITGCAGFIGFWLAKRCLAANYEVIGIDNLNDYYDVTLKQDRLNQLLTHSAFSFHKVDIASKDELSDIFHDQSFDVVVNLAAQAGVRYSLTNPNAYIDANIVGFTNILENCRHHDVDHLVFASSSSVYGANTDLPFSVNDNVDHPISLYAATKKSNELMAHAYAHLYNLSVTGLRFFTVYGPWGRPDMALFKFVDAIIHSKPLDVYNQGNMVRDFTYVEDITEGVWRVMHKAPQANPNLDMNGLSPATSYAPYRLYNIGCNNPSTLMNFIEVIEKATGKKAKLNLLPMQPGDVKATHADVQGLIDDFSFKPSVGISEGVGNFVQWYLEYYGEAGIQMASK